MSLSDCSRSIVLDQPVTHFIITGGGKEAVASPVPPPKPAAPPPPDIEAIRRQAFAEGEAKGRLEINAVREEMREKFARLERELDIYHENLERALFEQVVDLSMKTAEIILRRALPDVDMLRSVLREIIGRITDMDRVRVRLHPEDAEALKGDLEHGRIGPVGRIEIIVDNALQPGDVMVENGFGCFDARLPERLDLLNEELVKRWRKFDANPN